MFGWLATRSTPLCRHAPLTVVSRRSRQITPLSLIRRLPGLGNVLYLRASSAVAMPDDLPARVVVTQPTFAPLLGTYWLTATSVVTDDGPREWLECLDHLGRPRARLHLLPDTDYLAWDALIGSCEPDCHPPVVSGLPLRRPDNAAVVNFHVRELAGLHVLGQGGSTLLSPLSGRIAERIARAESALLLK